MIAFFERSPARASVRGEGRAKWRSVDVRAGRREFGERDGVVLQAAVPGQAIDLGLETAAAEKALNSEASSPMASPRWKAGTSWSILMPGATLSTCSSRIRQTFSRLKFSGPRAALDDLPERSVALDRIDQGGGPQEVFLSENEPPPFIVSSTAPAA